MAKMELGSANVDCPVCGKTMSIGVRADRVMHTKVFGKEDRVEHSARLRVVVDWDGTPPAGHEGCFVIDDVMLASLESLHAPGDEPVQVND